jgi:hypothetical protein
MAPAFDLGEYLAEVVSLDRLHSGQQLIERSAEAVNVACWAEIVHPTTGLFGAHVGRRTHDFAHLGRRRISTGGGA